MNISNYITKMELLGDKEAFLDGRIPDWVANITNKLENSVFKEISKSGIKDMDNPDSKGFYIGLGKLVDQLMQKVKVPEGAKSLTVENSQFIGELSNLYYNDSDKFTYTDDQLCEFYSAAKRGKESVTDKEGKIKHSTLSSEISLVMFMYWPFIDENIKTRRQMFDFLTKLLGANRVGEFKRVERFLQRIKFSPARPGRPRSKKCT